MNERYDFASQVIIVALIGAAVCLSVAIGITVAGCNPIPCR